MSRFRPCIDLHSGQVKQIVGGTLSDSGTGLKTNFVSPLSAGHFAALYRRDGATGGHVIQLGNGNETAAREALAAWPGGLQIGGGVNTANAAAWLDAGASHVIVTSFLFDTEGRFQPDRLASLVQAVGPKRLVIDLSCRRHQGGWIVAMNRWQTLTDMALHAATLEKLAASCDEFLIHAADVEGRMAGMDEELIAKLADWSPRPVTYAGGAASLRDLQRCHDLSQGRVDLTIGSALDIFGGQGIRYAEAIAFGR